jgi:hypothetical protein
VRPDSRRQNCGVFHRKERKELKEKKKLPLRYLPSLRLNPCRSVSIRGLETLSVAVVFGEPPITAI